MATFWAILMKIDPATQEIMRVETNCWDMWQNRHISLNISESTGQIFTKVSALAAMCGDHETGIRFAVVHSSKYGNQLELFRNRPPSLFGIPK